VGKKTTNKLLTQFGSIAKLRKVSLAELAQVIKRSQAQRVFNYLSANGAEISSPSGRTTT
jgi:excinuclease UvrABC nuclease subunit